MQDSAPVEKHNLILQALRQPGGLIDKAIAVCEEKMASHPHDSANLHTIVAMLRGRGDLKRAASIYRILARLCPNDVQVARGNAVFQGSPLPPTITPGYQTAPFVRIEGFLNQEEHNHLLNFLTQKRKAFRSSEVAVQDYPNPRSSLVLYEPDLAEIQAFFTTRVHAQLPHVFPRLGLEPFTPGRTEMQMVSHLDGDYYTLHRDSRDLDVYRDRRLSYVYYFHKEPATFQGGDLLLYDTDEQNDRCSQVFTALEPVNNSIVFFPSHYYHEVTPVSSTSLDLIHCRNALNGWMHGG